ncbi:carbohydrate ABC transporter permease [Paenibacillus sp. OAS669]|uniref:carbohydrate ABC transporter permease n=1 Tax=Paenibacillus sp. OAS669 TaxID=2663821 RepID=UPI00178A13D6|nr:carbohydrate ABC transporter permease [Paenibacillus sp. OAS669]MBE1445895.1 putative aldouronate transport system permease protein [Paenibacillus sp. OAS669]
MSIVVRRGRSDKIYDIVNFTFLAVLFVIVLYPLYFVVIASFSDPSAVGTGRVFLFPKGFNLNGYELIFNYKQLWIGYRNTVLYTIGGTVLSVSLTLMTAYAFSRKDMVGRGFIVTLFIIPMFIHGGLIPTYLLVRNLHMLDNPLTVIILGCVSMWNIIITRTFFQSTIPHELFEAAKMDGCGNISYFTKVVLPLSKAIIAVLVVFAAVGQWNSFFNALIYLNDRYLIPLQLVLREILTSQTQMMQQLEMGIGDQDMAQKTFLAESVKYGIIIVSSLPVLCIYPFAQKYFVQGVMIGSLKG